jgi:hypothetical protein
MIDDNYYCFEEGHYYDYTKFNLLLNEEFFKTNLCKKNGKFVAFNFTGFIFNNNSLVIVFPKGYPVTSGEEKLHIKALVNVLLRYKEEVGIVENEHELMGGMEGIHPEGFLAAINLLKDFLSYGYIRKEVVHHKVSAGNNIDWPKTINRRDPIISNNRPVYLDFVNRVKKSDRENLLYKLHRYAVQKSYKKCGWLMNLDEFDYDPKLDTLPCDKEMANYILSQELSKTFVDREIKLLNNIKHFIFGSSNAKKEKIETLATQYFHNIWEVICGDLFKNEYGRFKNLIPKPIWHVSNLKYKPSYFTRQIPDILYVEGETLYILDAKYYNIKRNLPGWHDLVKQFYYAYSLGIRLKTRTKNILLFPGVTNNRVEYFGFVDIENDSRLGIVQAFVIDIVFAMENYGLYKNQSLREKLSSISD